MICTIVKGDVFRKPKRLLGTVDDIPVLIKNGGLKKVTPQNDSLILEMDSTFPLQMRNEKAISLCNRAYSPNGMTNPICGDSVPQGAEVSFLSEKLVAGDASVEWCSKY